MPTRPAGVGRTAAAALRAQQEHSGSVAVQPSELVRASFAPGTSPSAPARKILALLLAKASAACAAGQWPDDNTFVFTRSELRVSSHNGTDRVVDNLKEFSLIELSTPTMLRGEEADLIEPLLRHRIVARSLRPGAPIALTVSDRLREIVAASDSFARLHVPLLLALESRYAVTLYGLGELLIGRQKPYEEIRMADVRSRLGIEDDAYTLPKDVRRLLEKAAQQVSQIAPFRMFVEPLRPGGDLGPNYTRGKGAAIQGFRIHATRKELGELQAAMREADSSRTGRKARSEGRVERVVNAILPAIANTEASINRAKFIKDQSRQRRDELRTRAVDKRHKS
jgi:hypothetical protein